MNQINSCLRGDVTITTPPTALDNNGDHLCCICHNVIEYYVNCNNCDRPALVTGRHICMSCYSHRYDMDRCERCYAYLCDECHLHSNVCDECNNNTNTNTNTNNNNNRNRNRINYDHILRVIDRSIMFIIAASLLYIIMIIH